MNPILDCLKSRLAWYERALYLASGGKTPEERRSFVWPDVPGIVPPPFTSDQAWKEQYIMYIAGCMHELRNTVDMMNHSEGETKP